MSPTAWDALSPPPSFDPTKPVATSDGLRAEILCCDFNGNQIAARIYDREREFLRLFEQDGTSVSLRASLVNIPVTHTREIWVNHYADGIPPSVHLTRGNADTEAGEYRIACVFHSFSFPEGHGLT